jgi:Ca-activated chloride channel homolog
MRYLILFFILFFSAAGKGQVVASVKSYDFGDLYNGSQTYVDVVFTNKTDKTQFLLTIDKPDDVYYIFSGKKMLPDSSITIRMKVNEGLKGKFNYAVDIYFSDSNDPTTVYLEGTIKEVSQNALTQCPDFNATNVSNPLEFTVVIKVIDSLTRLPIPNSKVYMVERGELVGQFSTNNKGIVQRSMPLGYYFITAEKDPYQSNFFEGYVNANRNYVEIELSQAPVEFVPEFDTTEVAYVPEEINPGTDLVELADLVDSIIEPEIVTVIEPVIIPPLADLPDSVFDAGYFKYNNITFVLDASSSMNGMGKLDLLKMSMIELVKILRPEDNITVLKYAAEVDVILQHTSGDKKEEIIQVIKGIKTSGSTAGGDAIKTAYALNQEKHIYEGNNLIIMITDGLFNKGATDYESVIAGNYQQHGTRFSVVGIKTTSYVSEHMQDIVKLGGGDYVQINTIQDAQTKLIGEIRRTSYKGS